jgi:hypothetical protein
LSDDQGSDNQRVYSSNPFLGCLNNLTETQNVLRIANFNLSILSEFLNNFEVVDALEEPSCRKGFNVAHVVLQVRLVLSALLQSNKIF